MILESDVYMHKLSTRAPGTIGCQGSRNKSIDLHQCDLSSFLLEINLVDAESIDPSDKYTPNHQPKKTPFPDCITDTRQRSHRTTSTLRQTHHTSPLLHQTHRLPTPLNTSHRALLHDQTRRRQRRSQSPQTTRLDPRRRRTPRHRLPQSQTQDHGQRRR